MRFALANTVSCIQGPPGTGKSQTIAALLDEFLLRHNGPARVLVTAFSYAALGVVIDKVRRARDASRKPTRAAQTQLVWLRSASRDPIADEPGLAHVTDLALPSGKTMDLDGTRLQRKGGKRLEDFLAPSFIVFANAFSLVKLGTESDSKKFDFELLYNGFGFDLIVVDEGSQLPTQQLLSPLALTRPVTATLRFEGGTPPDADSRRRASPAPDQLPLAPDDRGVHAPPGDLPRGPRGLPRGPSLECGHGFRDVHSTRSASSSPQCSRRSRASEQWHRSRVSLQPLRMPR